MMASRLRLSRLSLYPQLDGPTLWGTLERGGAHARRAHRDDSLISVERLDDLLEGLEVLVDAAVHPAPHGIGLAFPGRRVISS